MSSQVSVSSVKSALVVHIMILLSLLLSVTAIATSTTASMMTYPFDYNQATIGIWLSAAAFCPRDEYKTREFIGPTEGFNLTNIIGDKKSDAQGYVGYLPSDSSIYVVFRGSSSIRNWIADLDAFKV